MTALSLNARTLDGAPSPTYYEVVEKIVADERKALDVTDAINALEEHWKDIDNAKKWNAIMSGATTLAGTIGSNEASTASANGKKAFTYGTLVLGGLTTYLIGVRDDKDIATRIQTCQSVIQTGSGLIDAYQNTWLSNILHVPPVNTPARQAFDDQLETDGKNLATGIAALLAKCH
jgi:hypothetical protein